MGGVERRKLLIALLNRSRENSPLVVADGDSATDDRLTKLNHIHLPKLAGYRFICWERQTVRVEKGPNFDEIGPFSNCSVTTKTNSLATEYSSSITVDSHVMSTMLQ